MKYNPYSFSKISTFQNCPYSFKLKYIDKLKPDLSNLAMKRGSLFHYVFENWPSEKFNLNETNEIVDAIIDTCPDDLKLPAPFLTTIVKEIKNVCNSQTIQQLLTNTKIKEHKFKYNTLITKDENAEITGFVDAIKEQPTTKYPWLLDWKTGKINENENVLQLKMYAVYTFLKIPDINTIVCSFVYVEHDFISTYTFHRKYLPLLIEEINNIIINIEREQQFSCNVSYKCGYCGFKNICKYNK